MTLRWSIICCYKAVIAFFVLVLLSRTLVVHGIPRSKGAWGSMLTEMICFGTKQNFVWLYNVLSSQSLSVFHNLHKVENKLPIGKHMQVFSIYFYCPEPQQSMEYYKVKERKPKDPWLYYSRHKAYQEFLMTLRQSICKHFIRSTEFDENLSQ